MNARRQELRQKFGFAPYVTELRRAKAPAPVTWNPEWQMEGSRRRCRVVENASAGGLRVIERGARDATGWYVDNYQSDVTAAALIQLPARDGAPLYLAACTDPWNADCYIVDCELETDRRDAERSAAGLAKHYAETCREDDAKQMAEMQIDDARDAIKAARAAHTALAAEIHAARAAGAAAGPNVCAALRARLVSLRDDVRDARRIIKERQDNYRSAVTD